MGKTEELDHGHIALASQLSAAVTVKMGVAVAIDTGFQRMGIRFREGSSTPLSNESGNIPKILLKKCKNFLGSHGYICERWGSLME